MDRPRPLPRQTSRLIVLGLVALALSGGGTAAWLLLRDGSQLPYDPTIAAEDFGSGVTLGMPLEAAEAVALPDSMTAWFITREELAGRDPYTQRPREKDLLVVLHDADADAPRVVELRLFLQTNSAQAQLRGSIASQVGINEVQELYGPPYDFSRAMDGRQHLTYYFADQNDARWSYKLTISTELDGRIFAMALTRVFSPA